MRISHVIVVLFFVAVLGVPFMVRSRDRGAAAPAGSDVLVIITPHVQQIRYEFGRAFARWHEQRYGAPARVDFRTPGGTSEIRRQLEAQYQAEAARIIDELRRTEPAALADPGFDLAERVAASAMDFDLMFGGGSYDHTALMAGVQVAYSVTVDGRREQRSARVPISVPAGFTPAQLDEWYGPENRIGTQELYHPEQYWLGTALSSFGIVYNRDVLARLGVAEPESFEDMTDPRLSGWVALADPRQSGSVTTTMDSILGQYGWDEGWRILRAMAANARYFTDNSTKPPTDVSQGEAAMGLAIDFYGRGQAQVVMRPGETAQTSRVGYRDPASVYVDADPISILRGAPHPELARRFVEFCLTEEAQALWQFPARGEDETTLGPHRYELRRMPVRPVMYGKYMDRFIDKVNPFELASRIQNPGWRSGVQMMLGCLAIDIADEQRAAWNAMIRARATPGFDVDTLAEMERLFYAWPDHRMPPGPDGAPGPVLPYNERNYRAIKDSWADPVWSDRSRLAYTAFFRGNYRRIVDLAPYR